MAKSLNQKVDHIKVPGLNVQKNIISYGDSFICKKNISAMEISPVPANHSWIFALLLIIAGTVVWSTRFFLYVGLVWLAIVIIYNCCRGIDLAVSLNSGKTVYFKCENRQFLDKVLKVMIVCINDFDDASCYINFENCQIEGSRILNDAIITTK